MVCITQLIHILPGKEEVFHEFENLAIPILARHHGRLTLRLRPNKESVIEANTDIPYEVHLVEFDSQKDFEAFKQDKERKQFLHLKQESIKSSILIQGAPL